MLIIDTYNLLHVPGVLPPDLAGLDVRGLVALLGRSRFADEPTLLICDGRPAPGAIRGRAGGIRILYSGPARKADDLIMEFVGRSSSPRQITVVTTDREIVRAARKRRCRTTDSEDFLRRLVEDAETQRKPRPTDPRPTGGLSQGQVDHWKAQFQVDDDLVDQPVEVPRHLRPGAAPPPGRDTPTPTDAEAVEPPEAYDGPVIPEEILREAEELLRQERDDRE